jgi:hypothetical protein
MIPPTVITVNGVSASAAAQPISSSGLHNLDSFLYNSIDESNGDRNNNVVYNLDLEPIDFEHFVDEPEIGRNRFLQKQINRMFLFYFILNYSLAESSKPPQILFI